MNDEFDSIRARQINIIDDNVRATLGYTRDNGTELTFANKDVAPLA